MTHSRLQKPLKWIVGALLLGSAISAYLYYHFQNTDGLAAVHSKIEKQFPDVKHISGDDFASIDNSIQNSDYILLDVREENEFAVSHLSGAIRIDPNATVDDVINQIGDSAAGKNIIFYCSVGMRSSILADKSGDRLSEIGAKSIYNLQGGLFQWHNDKRAMFKKNLNPKLEPIAAQSIHGFDRLWSRLVKDQDSVVY